MSSINAELLVDTKAELAEGPVWYDDALWWVDINAGSLNRLNVNNKLNISRSVGDFLGAAIPAENGEWLLARGREIIKLDWLNGKTTSITKINESNTRIRCNDGKCDPSGRFHFGTLHRDTQANQAKLYRLHDKRIHTIRENITISNGMDWSPEKDRFYYTDTATNQIDVYDYNDETAQLSNRRCLIKIPEENGFPDGMTCDAQGNLWVALWGGSSVECFDPKIGKSIAKVSVPAKQITSCCFGGKNFDRLFITTAWVGYNSATRDSDPLAGGIFEADTGATGKAPTLAKI